jgi:predicted lipoprotein with Yx(FWY)xxD motif
VRLPRRLRLLVLLGVSLLPGAVFAGTAAAITGPPIVQNGTAVAVTGGVQLSGRVDPYGLDTHYHFEYGPTTAYGSSVPVPDADLGSGNEFVSVQQTVAGLQPNTTYHFRIVAVNGAGTTDSPDSTFSSYGYSSPPPYGEPPYGGGGGEGPAPSSQGSRVRIKVARAEGRRVLATSKGRTLYSLSAETKGRFICTKSSGCLNIWKPLIVPPGATVVGPVKTGTIRRPEGGLQATYRGRPLYTFVEDRPGEANGEGFKDVGTWHAVRAPRPKHGH